jgi:NADPH:quinone reductase-like Zn-dependent oxidoreductase
MTLIRYELGAEPTVAGLAPASMEVVQPKGDELLVRIEASSLNNHDFLVVTGGIKAAPGRVLLSDGVGVVEACGPDAVQFKVGDRVMGTFFPGWSKAGPDAASVARMRGDHVDGFAASYVTMPESSFTVAPANLDSLSAACLPCAGLTAWRALFVEGVVSPGDTVLVQGTGGVALFALQFAKAAGARVIATTGKPENVDRLKALGADAVIDRNDPAWGAAAAQAAGRGVDHLIEVAGGDLTQSLQAIRTGGRLCLVGVLSLKPIQIAPPQMIYGNRRISGITVGSREHQEAMIRAVEANGIKPIIDASFPLSHLRDAFERFSQQHHFGKIAISCG